jgi:hypothetical protein
MVPPSWEGRDYAPDAYNAANEQMAKWMADGGWQMADF